MEFDWLPWVLIAVVGFLYASVGHGGASGYLAMMALLGVEAALMKPSALILNIFVSMTAFIQYYRGGHFRWHLFWPFAIASVPMSFVGAGLPMTDTLYKKLLALALLIAIVRMLIQPSERTTIKQSPLWASMLIGGVIGLLSGMLGIGGGIILTPIMLVMNWGRVKEVAAASALFIFVNSLSGFASLLLKGYTPNPQTFYWLTAAMVGGFAGAYLGSRKFNVSTLRYILAFVLVIACIKLYFTKG